MINLAAAIDAYARGELELEPLLACIDDLLEASSESATGVFAALGRSFEEEVISAHDFALLKRHASESLERIARIEAQATLFEPDTVVRPAETPEAGLTPVWTQDLEGRTSPGERNQGRTGSPTGTDSGTGERTWSSPASRPASPGIGPGTVLKERFQLVQVLGVGGMGTVYKGVDLLKQEAQDRNPYIALKVLNEDFRRHPDAFIALQREASRQQRLAHPNIATVHDFDRTGQVVYIVMELLEGIPLNRYIRKQVRPRGGLPYNEAWPLIEGLGGALVYAHEHHVVHSDFKPGNCFLTRGGGVKVLDFGIARAMSHPGSGSSERTFFDPARLGALTPAYASPEMLEGQDPDPRDDVFAFACVCYELLSGKHPYNKLPALKARALGRSPASLKSLSRLQNRALRRALAFRREDRTPDVATFLAELRPRRRWQHPLAIAGALAVIALLGIVVSTSLRDLLSARAVEATTRRLQQADMADMAAGIAAVRALPADERARVLAAARDVLVRYYEARATSVFDPAQQRYGYPAAAEIMREARGLLPDSALLQGAEERLARRRDQLLSDLARRYEAALEAGALLPRDDASIADVLATLRQVSPAHPLLTDPRLPVALLAHAERALQGGDFERALLLVDAGRSAGGEPGRWLELEHRVNAARQRQERAQAIDRLASELLATLRAPVSLDRLLDELPRLRQLAVLDADHPILATLTERTEPLVRDAVESFIAVGDYPAAAAWQARYAALLDVLHLNAYRHRVEQAAADYDARIEQLWQSLHTALAAGQEERASAVLDQLGHAAPADPILQDARDALARALLTEARRARAEGKLQLAAQLLARAGAADPGTELAHAIEAEDALSRGGEGARVDRGALERRLDLALAQFAGSPGNLAPVQAAIDAMEAAFPTDGRLTQARSLVAARIASAVDEFVRGGRQGEGIALLKSALTCLPGNAEMLAQLTGISNRRTRDRLAARQSAIAATELRLARLAASPAATPAWTGAVAAALDELESRLRVGQPLAAQSRLRVGRAYLQLFQKALASHRLTDAAQLLRDTGRLAPDLPELAGARASLRAAEATLREQVRQEAMRSALAARRQDVLTLAQKGDVDGARKAFEALRPELPPGDTFVRLTAPQAIAAAYFGRARERAEAGDLASALVLARAGTALAPAPGELAAKIDAWSLSVAVSGLERHFAQAPQLVTVEAREWLAIVARAPARQAALMDRLAGSLIARAEHLGETDPGLAAALLQQGATLLPDSAALATAAAKAAALARPPLDAIAAALRGGRLSEAGDRIGRVLSSRPDLPGLEQLRDEWGQRTGAAEREFARFRAALAAGDQQLAWQHIDAATSAWRDNSDYSSARAQLRPGTPARPR